MSVAPFRAWPGLRSLSGQVRSRHLRTTLRLALAGQSEVRFRSCAPITIAPIEGLARSGQVAPHYWQWARSLAWRAQVWIPKSMI